jgi:hypothetical protein
MKWKNVLLAVVAFGIVASLLGPAVFAAPKAGAQSSAKEVSLLDPFTLRTLAMAGEAAESNPEAKVTLTRQDIRIPFRPSLRSAYRPTW